MKVLDLHCGQGHIFEGWFASEDDFAAQNEKQLVECPLCGDASIVKRLSAPRLNLSSEKVDTPEVDTQAALQVAWLETARKIVADTVDVGDQFAQEARRIHRGEAAERAIRGQATQAQARDLLEEGIAVIPLPRILGFKGGLH